MTSTSTSPNQKRRKIVTGSLAAPVVLTVSSPVAATVTTFGRCLRNTSSRDPGAFFTLAEKEDTWLRKPVTVYQLTVANGTDTGWFFPDPAARDFVRLGTMEAMGWGNKWPSWPDNWKKDGEGTRWALVWVDSNTGAQYKTIQIQQPTGYSATTQSCYSSLMPKPR